MKFTWGSFSKYILIKSIEIYIIKIFLQNIAKPLSIGAAWTLQSPSSSEAPPVSVGKRPHVQMCVCMWQALSIGALQR